MVGLFLFDDDLELVAQSGLANNEQLIEFALEICWQVVTQEQTIIKNQIAQQFVNFIQSPLSSCLGVPIKIRDEVIGAIFFGQAEHSSIFKREEKKFINNLKIPKLTVQSEKYYS